MASVGGTQALRFINDPKLNEHKIIGEKFKKKPYKSLAVELYKNKLQNNPMRAVEPTSIPPIVGAS